MATAQHQADWRADMRDALRSPADLVAAGLLPQHTADALARRPGGLQVRIPRYYAGLVDRRLGLRCPLLMQAVPTAGERDPVLPAWARGLARELWGRDAPWSCDPIGDLVHQPAPRLTHRYGNRALLHVTAACALVCRYCFRKEHLGRGEPRLYRGGLDGAIAYLRATGAIREVILTGGDPLSLPNAALRALLAELEGIAHLRHLRVHSRMPATLPSRLDDDLAALLGGTLPLSVTAHFNHPRELTRQALTALARLRKAGVVLYNQAVLLAGVNDRASVLAVLCQRLFEAGVTPYYLHHPDWTPGTFHFRVSIDRGRALVHRLAGRVAGPALPHYVCDIPGGGGKISLMHPRVRCLSRHRGDGLRAAVWSLPVPRTRAVAAGAATARYLDMSFARQRGAARKLAVAGASPHPAGDDGNGAPG